jgi:hypothetical protein
VGIELRCTLFLTSKETSEESWFFRVIGVTLATVRLCDTTHDLVDVLTAATPSCFATLAAGYLLAHVFSFY